MDFLEPSSSDNTTILNGKQNNLHSNKMVIKVGLIGLSSVTTNVSASPGDSWAARYIHYLSSIQLESY